MAGDLNLSNLKPAQPRKDRKRVGRGMGSGKGRYSGRGIKGQKSRAGSHAMRAGFEGGQMPLYMRTAKLRGNTSKDAMPVGPFRTYTQPVNLRDLETRFEAGEEVTPESLKAKGLIRSLRKDVKLLGVGELTKKLAITVHGAVTVLDLRARDHAVRHSLDHPPAPDRRRPDARAAAEGRRVGVRQDQPVHALPDGRARGRAGLRLCVPLPQAGRALGQRGAPRADHRHPHGRHDAPDVARRADHEARHRPRHLAPDLRLDPDPS